MASRVVPSVIFNLAFGIGNIIVGMCLPVSCPLLSLKGEMLDVHAL